MLRFCDMHSIDAPLPVSEPILCYFVTALANYILTVQTIRTYLSCSARYTHSLGVSWSPHTSSYMYAKAGPHSGGSPPSPCLLWQEEGNPLATCSSNPRTHEQHWASCKDENWQLYWATTALCYMHFDFFPSRQAHLTHRCTEQGSAELERGGGGVTFNHASQPTLLKIHLHMTNLVKELMYL